MPVRSLNLKLVIPRRGEGRSVAQCLWATHAAVNAAVHYYESCLLAMRGAGYVDAEEGEVTTAQVQERVIALGHAAFAQNGGTGPLPEEQVVTLLREIYEAIVPAAVGAEGTAQAANAYVGPLMDASSAGFTTVFDKLEDLPPWLDRVQNGDDAVLDEAQRWLRSEPGQARLHATGAPAKWMRLARAADPSWPVAFAEDIAKKRHQVQGAPSILRRLRELQVLPLFPPYLASRLRGSSSALNPWDRLAFRLAVGHLLSWESWCRRAATEHAARVARVDSFRVRHIDATVESAFTALRRYEDERREELSRVTFEMDRRFVITRRMVRAWPEVRERWRRLDSSVEAALLAILAEEQTRLRGRFGDPHLMRWLARPAQHHLWRDGDVDPVQLLAQLNAMERLVERSRVSAAMTLPEPRLHPRSVQWEPPGGSNLRNFTLRADKGGSLSVELPLLTPTGADAMEERTLTFRLAPSGQFRAVSLERKGRVTQVHFQDGAGEMRTGKLGSADLLLRWAHVRHRGTSLIEAGDIGPAWFKLTLDVTPMLPKGWDGRRPAAVNHFLTAGGQRSRYADAVEPGLRVLAVDLGLRTFATCSVFELKERASDKRLVFPVDDTGWYAVHERSFPLRLPDEQVDERRHAWHEQAREEMRGLRRSLSRYRGLYRLVGLSEPERGSCIESLQQSAIEQSAPFYELTLLEQLRRGSGAAEPVWDNHVREALRAFRRQFGPVVSAWRRRTRARGSERGMGKSIWAIDYLLNVRRFLTSWSLLGTESGDVRRLDRARRGIFASRLLKHIDGMREDRLKTGADLIVQAARGFQRDRAGRWVQAHGPCHVVLFEDLSRYRMRTDRPRRENSQLMKWAHRAVPAEVAMQGQLYGIGVCDTAAAFSSRFHAASGTPGLRCHAVTADDLQDPFMGELLVRENPGLSLGGVTPGTLIPLSGGEWFVCVRSGGGLTRLHADVNAAQNLQRRFWTRHADAFRLVTSRVSISGVETYVPRSLGKRLLGGLGSHGQLVPTGHATGSCRFERLTAAKWRKLSGSGGGEDENASAGGLEELAALEDEVLERSGDATVYFRDPSGTVLPGDLWYPAKTFWGIVRSKTVKALP